MAGFQLALFGAVLLVLCCPVRSSTVPSDPYALLQELEACAAGLADSGPENATIAAARLFLNYSASDAQTVNQSITSSAAFHRRKVPNADDIAYGQTLPELEANVTAAVLVEALDTCKRVESGALKRPASRPAGRGPLRVDDKIGYFVDSSGAPFIPTGYNQHPEFSAEFRTRAIDLGMTFIDAYYTPRTLLESKICCDINQGNLDKLVSDVKAAEAAGLSVEIFLGNGREMTAYSQTGSSAFPDWAEEKYPNISTGAGKTHFYSYDIDNPGARELLGLVLDALVPAVAPSSAVIGWSLANEPGFESSNSEYTFASFQLFLRNRYDNDTNKLAAAWNLSKLDSFADRRVFAGMGNASYSTRQRVDWFAFNDKRVESFYGWLCDGIRARYPNNTADQVRCYVKADNANSGIHPVQGKPGTGDGGIGRLSLGRIFGIAGCDTRALPTSSSHYNLTMFPQDLYAFDWLPSAASYDMMRTLFGPRPALDTEWHSVSTTRFRQPIITRRYIQSAMWFGHVHGLSLSMIWYWGRKGWTGLPDLPKEFAGADFYQALPTQPAAFEAYARGAVEINSVADRIVALATEPAQVTIFYSPISLMQDSIHADAGLSSYSLMHSLGVNIAYSGFTDAVASAAWADSRLVVVPGGASFVSSSAQMNLQKASESGAHVMIAGKSSDRSHAFAFDDGGVPAADSVRKWAASLPSFNFTIADEAAFRELEMRVAAHLDRPYRCVDASSNNAATAFGMFCRVARAAKSMFVMNLVNETKSIDVVDATNKSTGQLVNVLTGEVQTFPAKMEPLAFGLYSID